MEMENHSLEPHSSSWYRRKSSMYAKASGWKFEEERGIGITLEYAPHCDKILIDYKGKIWWFYSRKTWQTPTSPGDQY